MNREICRFIDSQKEKFLFDLERLIKIRSVREPESSGKPFGEGAHRVLSEALLICSEHGFPMINIDGYAGEIQFGSAPNVMLLSHLDVVPEGDNWTKDPYSLTIEGDTVYGRGTTDDKGAAIACLYALICCKELFGEPKTGVKLILGCGEETGSEDMEYYFKKREKLPYTFSPDADYPLINIEKGRFAPVFEKTVKGSVNEKSIADFFGGSTANIVPEKANALITGFTETEIKSCLAQGRKLTGADFSVKTESNGIRIYCTGKSAHAANPHLGINAQTALIELLNILPLSQNDVTESFQALRRIFRHNDTAGESAGVAMKDEKTGSLTLNFGVLKFSENKFICQLDLRLPMCANEENVKSVIEKELSDAGFKFTRNTELRPVHYVSENAPIVKEALKVFEEYTGKKGKCLAIGGGTYVHDIEGGVAFGIEFPETDYRIHGADEFAKISELLLTSKMYAQIIKDLCY